MASVTSAVPKKVPPKMSSLLKSITDDAVEPLTSLPSTYVFNSAAEVAHDPQNSIPTVDLSRLTSENSNLRSEAIEHLSKACQDWGFFMVSNHGVEGRVMNAIIDASVDFFNLAEDEKRVYGGKDKFSPIKVGTSFNRSDENATCWRDYLNLQLHPNLHFPDKPLRFKEALSEYTKATREMAMVLLRAISESLGLSGDYIEKASGQDEGFSVLTVNLYPPCPQPELAMGIAPHTDDGFLGILIQNGVGGLQLLRNGQWFNVQAAPNCYLVNVGDHMEIMSNGKYKSVLHRGVVNSDRTRMSVVTSIGPSLENVVGPIPELLDEGTNPPAYRPMKYKDYLEVVFDDVSISDVLSIVRIPPDNS